MSDSAERALWRAHLGLHGAVTAIEVSERELSDVARSVERAFAGLYDAWDGRVDASAGLGRATEEAQRAHALVHAGAELGELSRHLAAACDALASVRAALPSTREPAPPRVASPVRPALHHTARPSLVPTLRVRVAPPIITERYAPLAAPTSHDDLAQHGAKAAAHIAAHLERVLAKRERARQVLASPSEAEAFVSRWARECFDEVAMLASQRQPLLGDDWRGVAELETRMLRAMDAFAALGSGALAMIEALVIDAPAPDPVRTFAGAILATSQWGHDALGIAERVARWVGRDRDALGWFAEALCLAPHGDLVPMVRQWLDDSDPAYRAVAVRVLTSRGALSVEERTRCARDRPEIAALVVTDMALAGDDAVDEVIERLLERKAPPREAWIALAVRRRGHAVQRLRAQQRWDWLALLGTRGDAEEISRAALRDPTAESLASVGCAGLVTSVEPLIELTRHEDEAIAIAAARALWRMTAAPLIGVVHIAPEIAFAPDLPDPPTGGLASPMPRSASPDEVRGSDDMVSLPLPDHGAWSAWWRAHRDGFDQNLRHRAGKPWSLAVAHDELARSGELDVRERSQLAAELTMIGGVGVGFDISALVVDQLDALTRWHAALAGIGPRPGAWPG